MTPEFQQLDEYTLFEFPSPDNATKEGIVGAGGNLSPSMLLSAYSQGVFPWYSEGGPILWWNPDPRFVLFPRELHVSRSMQRLLNRGEYSYSLDTQFRNVIEACSIVPRTDDPGTWITREMIEAYVILNTLGFAHSVEVWREGKLAGGLYGVSLGGLFFGESMFFFDSNASKAGFIFLVKLLHRYGFLLVDCQIYTPHLESLGARQIARDGFLSRVAEGMKYPTKRGSWEHFNQSSMCKEKL